MGNAVDDAFQAAPRRNFLPPDIADQAEINAPLPIGFAQTNSQPATVAMMLDWLDVEPGQKVLDVGSGSGWTSALLSHLTGKRGMVHAVEIIPELLDFGRSNCAQAGITNVVFHQAGPYYGWPPAAPFDRILVGATAPSLPLELQSQLAPNGRLVIPVKNTIYIIDKDENGQLTQREHPGFTFVPLMPPQS